MLFGKSSEHNQFATHRLTVYTESMTKFHALFRRVVVRYDVQSIK